MEKSLLIALLISGLSGTSSVYSRYYYFVSKAMTWLEAQSYCRTYYTDLATADNMEEMKLMIGRVDPQYSGSLWIGLNKIPPRRWGWSSGEILEYSNWKAGEPNNGDVDGICAAKYMYDGWIDADCTFAWEFVCYSELNDSFIHIRQKVTWRTAQAYCRQFYTDLVTIHNEEEHQYLSDLLGSVQHAWIGLFFDNWKWSDQQNTTFRYWRSGQPYSPTGNANCVAMVTQWNGYWNDELCNGVIPFMCYKAKTQRIFRLKITSGGQDLNSPAMTAAILSQIEERMRMQGVGNDTIVSWRVKNGKVFQLDNVGMIKTDKCV